jgi:hypothetical protein
MEGTGCVTNHTGGSGGSGLHAMIYEALKMADRQKSMC